MNGVTGILLLTPISGVMGPAYDLEFSWEKFNSLLGRVDLGT